MKAEQPYEFVCHCFESDPRERNGHSASCNRYNRKAEQYAAKKALEKSTTKKPIAKVGTRNTFECSDGERVNQADINYYRSEVYKSIDLMRTGNCEGCGGQSQGHAHIIPQSRCKQLNKTELIWDTLNIFHACHNCNAIAENVSSIGITRLFNYPRIKAFLELHDPERFTKLCYTENEPHKL